MEAVPFSVDLLLDLVTVGVARGWSFLMFSALSFSPRHAVVIGQNDLLLSTHGKRFPLLSALLCCASRRSNALLCFLGALGSFGFAFFFLPSGHAGARLRGKRVGAADAGDKVKAVARVRSVCGWCWRSPGPRTGSGGCGEQRK